MKQVTITYLEPKTDNETPFILEDGKMVGPFVITNKTLCGDGACGYTYEEKKTEQKHWAEYRVWGGGQTLVVPDFLTISVFYDENEE